MKSKDAICVELRQFIVEAFLFGDSGGLPADHESFMDTGIIDSTGMLEVVMFLEQNFDIRVEDHELIPENLDSLANLAAFVSRKQHAG